MSTDMPHPSTPMLGVVNLECCELILSFVPGNPLNYSISAFLPPLFASSYCNKKSHITNEISDGFI
jgi:hypothetical protein